MKSVIEVNNLSKSYQISHQKQGKAPSAMKSITNILKKPLGGGGPGYTKETFWALNEVSFKVKQGEIFGVVGKNGSGKSTLLKVLSRIVDPTKGEVTMRGKVASLLEVGTGFHPELTGRENVFLNGSMLGLSRQEITRKFNEIVEFSEVERFLDTPVKFYSSGMYVRLAFSVAAHLEPDILILDEVLSVGDAAFQKKSLNKIMSTMEEGRTVLFVSHSMGSVQQLCSRGLLLKDGHVDYLGPVGELTERYMAIMREENPDEPILDWEWKNDGSITNEHFIPKLIYIADADGKKINKPTPNNQDYFLHMDIDVLQENDQYTIGYVLANEGRTPLYMTFESDLNPKHRKPLKKGPAILKSRIPAHLLNGGAYRLALAAGVYNKFWIFDPETRTPSVQLMIAGGLSESPFWLQPRTGLLAPVMDWEIIQ